MPDKPRFATGGMVDGRDGVPVLLDPPCLIIPPEMVAKLMEAMPDPVDIPIQTSPTTITVIKQMKVDTAEFNWERGNEKMRSRFNRDEI